MMRLGTSGEARNAPAAHPHVVHLERDQTGVRLPVPAIGFDAGRELRAHEILGNFIREEDNVRPASGEEGAGRHSPPASFQRVGFRSTYRRARCISWSSRMMRS